MFKVSKLKKFLAILIITITISLVTTSVFAHKYHYGYRHRHNNGIVVGILGGILLGNLLSQPHRHYTRTYYPYRRICTYEREVYEVDEYGDRYYLGTETIQRYCR